jgi:hypothetical protein
MSLILPKTDAVGPSNKNSANLDHLESATQDGVDPVVFFEAHLQSRLVICPLGKNAVEWQATG